MTERQELYCHECKGYVQFDLDMELDGNYVLTCPKCGHEHCRVIKNGKITADRWDQRNSVPSYPVSSTTVTYSSSSTFTTYYSPTRNSSASPFLYNAWVNVT